MKNRLRRIMFSDVSFKFVVYIFGAIFTSLPSFFICVMNLEVALSDVPITISWFMRVFLSIFSSKFFAKIIILSKINKTLGIFFQNDLFCCCSVALLLVALLLLKK